MKKRPADDCKAVKCPHEIAKDALFRVLGNPDDLDNFPCDDDEFQSPVYEVKEICWKFWTDKLKV